MTKEILVDPTQMILGSALRRVLPYLLGGKVRYNPDQTARPNDLVFGEITRVPNLPSNDNAVNWTERVYPGRATSEVVICREPLQQGPFLGVIGNRYAPPYLVGGLSNPLDLSSNGEIRGGTETNSLFGANCVGFVNGGQLPEGRALVRIFGVLTDAENRPLSLRSFREKIGDISHSGFDSKVIVIAGHSTDSGKSVCARAMVSDLRRRGYRVTAEKKTGTACCKDWMSFFAPDITGGCVWSPEKAYRVRLCPDLFPARDFVDGLGIASDVSLEADTFAAESARYTDSLLNLWRPQAHVIELADNIAHRSNWRLLNEPSFHRRVAAIVYCPYPSFEAVAHFLAFLQGAFDSRPVPVLLSGPMGNEERHAMARLEVTARLKAPVVPCAKLGQTDWLPDGKLLVDQLLSMVDLQEPGAQFSPLPGDISWFSDQGSREAAGRVDYAL